MTNRIFLHLHLALAKSIADYLSEAGDDKDKALEAMRRDLIQREGQNSKARSFQRAYAKLVEKLKLPAEPDDAESASDAALEAVTALSAAGASSSQITAMLTKLGLDPAKLEEQVSQIKAQAEQGAEAVKLRRELAFRDAADSLGYDAGKLAKVLRDETGIPEKRKVKVQENGSEVEREVWGVAQIESGKEKTFIALTDHNEVKGFEAALKKTASTEENTAMGPNLPNQRPNPTPSPSNMQLDQAGLIANIQANGAGSI